MIFADAHVHIYPCYDLDNLVASLCNTVFPHSPRDTGEPNPPLILLTDSAGYDTFAYVQGIQGSAQRGWTAQPIEDSLSLRVEHESHPGRAVFFIRGWQAVCRQRIEVLGLGLKQRLPDGLDLEETIQRVYEADGLAVLPWGAGKWLGRRGRLIESVVQQHRSERLFLGDNGSRPCFWPTPRLIQQGERHHIRTLSGSDPLPLSGEEHRIGSFGSVIHAPIDYNRPGRSVVTCLAERTTTITGFGTQQNSLAFIRQQIRLRRQAGQKR